MLEKILLAQAQEAPSVGGKPAGIYNPALSELIGKGEGIDIINLLLGNIISILFILAIVVAFIFLIIGSIQMATAGGNKEKISSASGKVVSAITGLIILFSIFAIIKLIGAFFGIEELENLFFDISPYIIE